MVAVRMTDRSALRGCKNYPLKFSCGFQQELNSAKVISQAIIASHAQAEMIFAARMCRTHSSTLTLVVSMSRKFSSGGS
jgi:hypothetical protein